MRKGVPQKLTNEQSSSSSSLHVVPSGTQYVLCLIYKGKPTHHSIGPGEDGKLLVNKRAYNGGQDTIEELVQVLSKPGVKGWPAPLSIPIIYNEETAKGLPDGSGNVDGHSAAVNLTMPWLHPKIKKADAEGTCVSRCVRAYRIVVRPTLRVVLESRSCSCMWSH